MFSAFYGNRRFIIIRSYPKPNESSPHPHLKSIVTGPELGGSEFNLLLVLFVNPILMRYCSSQIFEPGHFFITQLYAHITLFSPHSDDETRRNNFPDV
jgi:hypothetical protein